MDKIFTAALGSSKRIVALTGAGVSAESGIPTFRGPGGYWRQFNVQDLANPRAFKRNPGLVWEFYHYRREVVLQKAPNAGHFALSQFERKCGERGVDFALVTQNVDELHKRAGSENIVELHGSLFKTRCLACRDVQENYKSPICAALEGKGDPKSLTESALPVEALPRCERTGCGGLLRPHIVWFDENLEVDVLAKVERLIDQCDLFLVIGTSSVVYPAASFAPAVASRGVPVFEFNIEQTPGSSFATHSFVGPSSQTLPNLLSFDT